MVNRNRGAGTRVWLDRLLAGAGIDPAGVLGYENEVNTHAQVAQAVSGGEADIGVGIYAAARVEGLDFIPLMEERFDLVMPRLVYESELVAPLLRLLGSDDFKGHVDGLGGYVTRETGAASALTA